MKKTSIMLTVMILASIILVTVPVNATQPIIYSASGTLDSYCEYPSATVVGGSWRVEATENKVWFEATYLELNLDPEVENSPAGSIDKFELKLGRIFGYWWVDGDTIEILGAVRFKKEWVMMDGSVKNVVWWSGKLIRIDSEGIVIDEWPEGPSYGDILGTTQLIDYV